MVWLGRLTGLCAICLLLFDRTGAASYLLNLQLGVAWPGVNVQLFANNVTNAQPMLQRFADAPGSALVYAYTLRPRTVGLMGTWTF